MKSTQRMIRLALYLALLGSLLIACVAAPAASTDSAPADDAHGC